MYKYILEVAYECLHGNAQEVFSNLIRILIASNQCNVQNGASRMGDTYKSVEY